MSSRSYLRRLNLSNIRLRFTQFLYHECAVFRTEADAIAERGPDGRLTCFVGDIVEIAVGIRFLEIDRRRNSVRVHRAERGSETSGATPSLWMADLRFRRRHRNPRGVAVERAFQRAGFNAVVQNRRRAVKINVSDAFRFEPGI